MISLQLLVDVPSGTGHLAGLDGSDLEFDGIHSSHGKPNIGCSLFQVYQSCKGCCRDGKGRTVLLWLTRCQHSGNVAQHSDSLKSIVPSACSPACSNVLHFGCMLPESNPSLIRKCFIAAYFCLCFLLMCSTPGKHSVSGGNKSQKGTF